MKGDDICVVFSSLQFVLIFMPLFFGCYYAVPYCIQQYLRRRSANKGKSAVWCLLHIFTASSLSPAAHTPQDLRRQKVRVKTMCVNARNRILMLGSLCFYLMGTLQHPAHFAIFLISIMLDFWLAVQMEAHPTAKKPLLLLGVVFHLVCLCTFKYAGFLFQELRRIIPTIPLLPEIILPVGISFYTFQGLSYLLDVYRGSCKAEQSLLRYTVYIAMFEQLIAGPIVTYGQVRQQLQKRSPRLDSIVRGIGTFIFGLGFKVLLANPLGKLWSQVCAIGFESLSTPLAWMGAWA